MTDEDEHAILVRNERTCYSGWNLVREYEVESANDRSRHRREVVHRPDLTAVLAYSARRRTAILVSQRRAAAHLAGWRGPLVEAPSGRIDPGETPGAAAMRELREETGLLVSAIAPVAKVFLHPALSIEQGHLFLCDLDTCLVRRVSPDANDMLGGGRVIEVDLRAAAQGGAAGLVADGKTALLLALLQLRRPELFAGSDT